MPSERKQSTCESGTSRRDLVAALLGAAGVAALSACRRADGETEETDEAVDALFGSNLLWMNNIAQMRAKPGATHDQICVLEGYHHPGDGGGGLFRWVVADAPVDDDGGIVIAAGADPTNYWHRIDQPPVSVKWFGARGNNQGDDTVAIQAALSWVMNHGGGKVVLPRGVYPITSAIRVGSNITLEGSGAASVLRKDASLHPVAHFNAIQNHGADVPIGCVDILLGSTNVDITIKDLAIDGGRADAFFDCTCVTGQGIFFHDCRRVRITGCEIHDCTNDGIVIQWGDRAVVEDCNLHHNNKAAIYLSGAERVTVSRNLCAYNMAAVAVACSWHCSVVGNVTRDGVQTNVAPACGAPSARGGGILIGRDSRFCTIVGNATESIVCVPEAFTGDRHGETYADPSVLYGVRDSVISGNTVRGKPSDAHGISIANGSGNVVMGNVLEVAQHGIGVIGASRSTIAGNRISSSGIGWGIVIQNAAAPWLATGAVPSNGNVVEGNDIRDDRAPQQLQGVLVQSNVQGTPVDNVIRFNRSNLSLYPYEIAPGNLEYGNDSPLGPRPWHVRGGLVVGDSAAAAAVTEHLSVQTPVTWTPAGPVQPGSFAHVFVSVPGAEVGDTVAVGVPLSIAGAVASGTVGSTGAVLVSVVNPAGSGFQQPLPAAIRVDVWKH